MKRNYSFKFLTIICVLTYILSSCNTGIDLSAIDDSSIKIDESLVMPVGEANMSLKQLLDKIGIPDGIDTTASEINFTWKFTEYVKFKSLNLSDSIKELNKAYLLSTYLPAMVGVPIAANTTLPTIKIDDSFDLGLNQNTSDQRVDSIKINASDISISFDISDDLKQAGLLASDFSMKFVFPNDKIVIENGINPSYTPTAYNQWGHILIGKYTMYLGKDVKTLPYQLQIFLKPSIPITLTPSSQLSLTMKFSSIDYKAAYGYFDLKDGGEKFIKIPFNIADYLPDAFLRFANPIVNIKATSNVGADLDVNVDYLAAYYDADPTFYYAWFDNHTTKKKHEHIPGPVKYGETTSTNFAPYDSKNGETDQLFDKKPYPDMLRYKIDVTSDPTRLQDFITSDSKVQLDIKIETPLKLKGGSTFDFSDSIMIPSLPTEIDNVDSAVLVLKLKNGLPVRAKYRMTFWKSTTANDTVPAIGTINTVVDDSNFGNMFSQYIVNAPTVDAAGDVTAIVPQTIKIMLNKTQIAALKQTKFIVFKVSIDNADANGSSINTHLTTKSNFGVKLGIFVKGSLTTNLGTSN